MTNTTTTNTAAATSSSSRRKVAVVVATRLHLGNSATAPSDDDLRNKLSNFCQFCGESFRRQEQQQREVTASEGTDDGVVVEVEVSGAVVAVDCTPKIEGYDLVDAVRRQLSRIAQEAKAKATSSGTSVIIIQPDVLPVTPWGKFVPALNAIVSYASDRNRGSELSAKAADFLVLVSAETAASASSMSKLFSHLVSSSSSEDDTLVVGAALPGHDYRGGTAATTTTSKEQETTQKRACVVDLDGRTCPWNTLAIWNLNKLALTGFQLVSDGILTDDATDPSYGVEETVAVCVLQRILGPNRAKAKLVLLDDDGGEGGGGSYDVTWDRQFEDPERRRWHENKMQSKRARAQRQLELIGLSGKVHHC